MPPHRPISDLLPPAPTRITPFGNGVRTVRLATLRAVYSGNSRPAERGSRTSGVTFPASYRHRDEPWT
jgi:hypothetical protein